ncbi:MAG: non-canonical purine NTP pyrophosphatase, partial [Gemmatimonadales bacterium]
LLIATRNHGKQPELRSLFAPLGVTLHFPDDLGLAELAEEAGLERFETFIENARAKAEYFHRRSGLPTVADDSGVEVDALGGAPGVHSKRFAGLDGPDHQVTAANNAEMLRRLADVPDAQRTARYRGVLVLVCEGLPEVVVDGVTEGRIARVARGEGGFGYDPLFVSDELGKSFGEATAAEKASVSHRARAARALIAVILSGPR